MKLIINVMIKIERFILPIVYRFWPVIRGMNSEKRNEQIVVSLTTYNKRLKDVDLCIRSLLNQKLRPDLIVLYLGNDVSEDMLPNRLKKLRKYGVKTAFEKENLRSHKKYFYAMQEYPHACIITVDDDAIYDSNLVSDLYKKHKKHPNAVVARTVKVITKDEKGVLAPYRTWPFLRDYDEKPRMDLVAVGVGGILYPPSIFSQEAFDKENIIKHSQKTDDIWLKFHEVKVKVPVVFSYSPYFVPIAIERNQKEGLFVDNVLKDANDISIASMEDFTGIYLGDQCS